MNEETTFNERIPYVLTLNHALQSIYEALKSNNAGDLEIANLYHLLPVEIKTSITQKLNEIQKEYNNTYSLMPQEIPGINPSDEMGLREGRRLPPNKYKQKIEEFYESIPVPALVQRLSIGLEGQMLPANQIYADLNSVCILTQMGIITEAMDKAGLLIWRDRNISKGEFYPQEDLKAP